MVTLKGVDPWRYLLLNTISIWQLKDRYSSHVTKTELKWKWIFGLVFACCKLTLRSLPVPVCWVVANYRLLFANNFAQTLKVIVCRVYNLFLLPPSGQGIFEATLFLVCKIRVSSFTVLDFKIALWARATWNDWWVNPPSSQVPVADSKEWWKQFRLSSWVLMISLLCRHWLVSITHVHTTHIVVFLSFLGTLHSLASIHEDLP